MIKPEMITYRCMDWEYEGDYGSTTDDIAFRVYVTDKEWAHKHAASKIVLREGDSSVLVFACDYSQRNLIKSNEDIKYGLDTSYLLHNLLSPISSSKLPKGFNLQKCSVWIVMGGSF